ncbi:hypothetical protein niasHT_021573 [Heterodera trifolii]|uniref:Insulin-like domain-containing protein n=1 Tax=Heterodera trifolii TaxID=157864 RepID=A0ABD2KRX1_9BILA
MCHRSHAATDYGISSCCCSYCSTCNCCSITAVPLPTTAQPVVAAVAVTVSSHHRVLPYHRPSMIRMLLLSLLMLYCCYCHTVVQCSPGTVWNTVSGAEDNIDTVAAANNGGGIFLVPQQQLLVPLVRREVRTMPEVAASRGLGWRKRRYYVGRWASGGAGGSGSGGQRRRTTGRRYVQLPNNEDENVVDGSIIENDEAMKQQQRLCGLKLTNRTKQLCGDCVPANMRQVILLDKKHGQSGSSRSSTNGAANLAFSKERLTEMCCVQRCTDDQIRSFCCRGRT